MKKSNNFTLIESALDSDKQAIKTSSALDYKILTMAENYEPVSEPKRGIWHNLARGLITVLVLFVFFLGYNTYQEVSFKQQCLQTYRDMVNAVEKKNIEESLSFYDFSTLNANPEMIKRNITELYNNFDDFKYDIHNIKIKTRGKEAVGTSRYVFYAFNNGKKVLSYKGEDRIYFKKEDKQIKIYAWISK